MAFAKSETRDWEASACSQSNPFFNASSQLAVYVLPFFASLLFLCIFAFYLQHLLCFLVASSRADSAFAPAAAEFAFRIYGPIEQSSKEATAIATSCHAQLDRHLSSLLYPQILVKPVTILKLRGVIIT